MPIDVFDLIALVMLFAAWLTIGWFIESPPQGRPSVSVLMTRFRREWMRQFVTRDPRIFDGNILASLREGTAFFASACMIAIGGGLALIGNTDQLRDLASEFEVGRGTTVLWEIKLLLPMFFVSNAFLKFVWSHRLFGYCAVMMAAVPNDARDPEAMPRADQAAQLNITAARNYNAGLRSVYFALGSLGWMAGPWALVAGTVWVSLVTWRREFASTSRKVMLASLPAPRLPDHASSTAPGSPPQQP
ncbi:DUF599 domain-containing protein [Paracoccus sp. TK19116]|uniref:DUF599 domain-containing protein n=1 Tax=Paracoccus albicereus TaxID=2922394 RepID=A0ABT1MQ78_9RHOB|nr:DUF599 domain-containing protein [Paracoccus albicereus]MCQ0970284.1 DUF599 domain-containing protein [Paracoccus albicereus]